MGLSQIDSDSLDSFASFHHNSRENCDDYFPPNINFKTIKKDTDNENKTRMQALSTFAAEHDADKKYDRTSVLLFT